MGKKDYRKLEEKIMKLAKPEGIFQYDRKSWTILLSGKPRSDTGGECKTDIFILAESENETKEFKISVKIKSKNEFQENKIKAERAESIFGKHYQRIIRDTAKTIEKEFKTQPLIFKSGKHPTKPNSITMGWKLEIASKPRKLSARLSLTDQEIKDHIYKGLTLSDDKKHSFIFDKRVENCGIAEYILCIEEKDVGNIQDVFDRIQLIDEANLNPMYLIFTANNFRTDKETKKESPKSTDGKRPLAVWVKWEINEGKLSPIIQFEKPLTYTGFDVKLKTLLVLEKFGKSHPKEMDEKDIMNPEHFYQKTE